MKLTKKGDAFHINKKKVFKKNLISGYNIDKAFNFAYQMCFGVGHHRSKRSGGQVSRRRTELFANTFQGKLAELITFEALKFAGVNELSEPDFSIHGKGIWDDSDLICGNYKINIKSAGSFSNLLLLEQKDWNSKGEYVPNLKNKSAKLYDFFVVVRLSPDIKEIFKKNNFSETQKLEKVDLVNLIKQQEWFYDFGGVATLKTFKYIIENEYILPQNSLLNGKIKMDASNYYMQCGNLKGFEFLIEKLSHTNKR